MEPVPDYAILSIIPVLAALILAFVTREAAFSLFVGCLLGVIISGQNPAIGMVDLMRTALGNADFIWVTGINIAVGITVAFYMRAGVIQAFTIWASRRIKSRRNVTGFSWILGLFIFFSDYFSPLFTGPIMRPLTDKNRVSREMLAYILDSGSAPVCLLIPVSSWAVYIASLLNGYGPIDSTQAGMQVFVRSIGFNFYAWFAVIMTGLYAYNLLPHFGPMRKAEQRALTEGKVLRDGATPMSGEELTMIQPRPGKRSSVFWYLIVPVLIVFNVAVGSFLFGSETLILEAFLCAVAYQVVAMNLGRHFTSIKDMMDVVLLGIKSVLPAVVMLTMAYCINTVSRQLGLDHYLISLTEAWMSGWMLPLIAFLTAGLIAFFTGSSWGTYAITIPIVLPLAFSLSNGVLDSAVLLAIGGVVGGGLFGDHCSPVSDTTVLSSYGAGSDHIDHVTTQLPYALVSGLLACLAFAVAGMLVI